MDLARHIIYQFIGLIALGFTVFSFQFKDFKKIMIAQMIGCALWTTHYLIGGAFAAAIMDGLNVFRSLGFAFIKDKKKRCIFTWCMSTLFVGASVMTVFVFNELWFIALVVAVAAVTGVMFIGLGSENSFKYAQLFVLSPCWIFNNIWYMSIGGLICEGLDMTSVIVYFVRTRRLKTSTEK